MLGHVLKHKTICPVCEISEGDSKHHLIPKCKKGKEIILICTSCHKQIHSIFTNKQLQKQYFSINFIKQNEEMQKWIQWRQKHPNANVVHKPKKHRL